MPVTSIDILASYQLRAYWRTAKNNNKICHQALVFLQQAARKNI
jgi:hypothetical protein